MKTCSRIACAAEKSPQPLVEFVKDKRASDGLASQCKSCSRKNWKSKKLIYLASQRAHYLKNKDEIGRAASNLRKQKLAYYLEKERGLRLKRADQRSQYMKAWRRQNGGLCNFYTANRKARKIRASPRWLSVAHKDEIKSIYKKARALGLEVDHVVPLQGRSVSGLHVPWNLQALSKTDNRKKYNNLGSAT